MIHFSKTHPSSLNLKGGSTAFPKPLFNSLYDPFVSPCRGQKPQGDRGCSWLRSVSARVFVSATESLPARGCR